MPNAPVPSAPPTVAQAPGAGEELKPTTVREVELCRAAFLDGAAVGYTAGRYVCCDAKPSFDSTVRARYPMPMVEVQRIVRDNNGYEWAVFGQRAAWRANKTDAWCFTWPFSLYAGDIHLLADLFAAQTEQAPADDPRANGASHA